MEFLHELVDNKVMIDFQVLVLFASDLRLVLSVTIFFS